MKSIIAPILMLAVPALGQTPVLTHVFDIKAEIGEAINGVSNPHGVRVTIPITGGTVTGKVNGKIIPGGFDYLLVNPEKKRAELQAIYTIMTNDSIAIHVCNEGIYRWAPTIPTS